MDAQHSTLRAKEIAMFQILLDRRQNGAGRRFRPTKCSLRHKCNSPQPPLKIVLAFEAIKYIRSESLDTLTLLADYGRVSPSVEG